MHEASTPFHGAEKNFSFTGEYHIYVLRISWPVFVESNHLKICLLEIVMSWLKNWVLKACY